MFFKDLKVGYPIYVFDRSKVELVKTKAMEVVPPHFDNKFKSPYGSNMEMVVDVVIEGLPKTYTFMQNTDIGYFDNLILSTEVDNVLREVEALKTQSEQALSKREIYEANIDKCTHILAEFSPAYRDKQNNEKRFSALENSVGELKDMIKGLVKELKG